MPARPRSAPALLQRTAHLECTRLRLADGAATTVYVARHPAHRTALRVLRLPRPEPLEAWCRRTGVPEALVGGFYMRPDGLPLGELRTRGLVRASAPFDAPWDAVRACVHAHGGRVAIAPRTALPE